MVKLLRAHGGCLGVRRRRRAWLAAISFGEPQAGVDPEIPEWGNPVRVIPGYPEAEYIGPWRRTRGTETSQYPQEKKSTEILLVAASERGRGQTSRRETAGVVGLPISTSGPESNRLGRRAREGESPVSDWAGSVGST